MPIPPPRTGLKRIHLAATLVLLVVLFRATTNQRALLSSSPTVSKLPSPPVRLDAAQVRKKLLAMGQTPLLQENEGDPWKAELFARLDHIRVSCGTLCQLNTPEAVKQRTIPVPGSPIPMAVVPDVNCPAIMGDEGIDAGDTTAPAIPNELRGYFTLGGSYEISQQPRRRDIYLGTTAKSWKKGNVWEQADVDAMVEQIRQGVYRCNYGLDATNYVRDQLGKIAGAIKDKRILVVGSETPWVESILLLHGAAEVVTLEYGALVSNHPRLKAMVPQQFRDLYFSGELGQFDGVVTHSSLEHSGLGRYGDALNPWGDILAVARTWCVTKDAGFLYLGLPTGQDLVHSNWHRVYGKLRWPLVSANWRSLDRSDGSELNRDGDNTWNFGGHGYIFEKVSKTELGSIAKIG